MNGRSTISMLLIGVVLYCPQMCLGGPAAKEATVVKRTCSCSHCAQKGSPASPGRNDPNGCGCHCLCKGAIVVDPATLTADSSSAIPAIDGSTIVEWTMFSRTPAHGFAPTSFLPVSAREICALLVSLQL